VKYTIKPYDDELVICEVSGRLLVDDEVNQIISDLEKYLEYNLLLNLKDLEYTSSAGLSLFIRLLTRTRIQNKKIVLSNVQENVMKLFTITKLNDIFTIFETEENAINSIKK